MNTNINIDAVMRCGEADGWEVRADRQGNSTIFEFYKFTPAGQDFYFTASMTMRRACGLGRTATDSVVRLTTSRT